jgi:hypothetical protein
MDVTAKIEKLRAFREKLIEYGHNGSPEARQSLNENAHAVRREVIETGCFQTITISPPPAVGGLLMKNIDPFSMMFEAPYGRSLNPFLRDMLDQAIGVLRDWEANGFPSPELTTLEVVASDIEKGFVFIAMPMAEGNPSYEDVHDAIKGAADTCGLNAERVDDVESNERITDRVLESIRRAEFVVADLTDARPNVFYEAGYAQGLGKTPIYIARHGTNPEFDLKDYPIIFFRNMRELRDKLEKRLRAVAEARA